MRKILSDDEISKNLERVMQAKKLPQVSFSKQLGITKSNLSEYLSGKRKAINLFSKMVELGVNGNWYVTGEGAMFELPGGKTTDDPVDYSQIADEDASRYAEIGRVAEKLILLVVRNERKNAPEGDSEAK
jgi:transcriptional regulator with XRE-family HTH domain